MQAVLKAKPGMKNSSKRPNLLMTAGIGVAERDEKKEHLYSLMGQLPHLTRCHLEGPRLLPHSQLSNLSDI